MFGGTHGNIVKQFVVKKLYCDEETLILPGYTRTVKTFSTTIQFAHFVRLNKMRYIQIKCEIVKIQTLITKM